MLMFPAKLKIGYVNVSGRIKKKTIAYIICEYKKPDRSLPRVGTWNNGKLVNEINE